MKQKIVLIITILLSSYSMAEEYKGDTGLLSNQLADWCVAGGQYQNFCHGYLMGVYETTSCLVTRKSPDWNELKKVYLGWFYYNGNNAPVSASATANLAFKDKYGCHSTMTDYLSKLK